MLGIPSHCSRQRALSPYTWHLFPSQQREAFKKRWFTLDHRRLMYFKDPLVRWRPDLWQLRAGSECSQRLCFAVREACRFLSCSEWTLGLPLSIPLSSSHAFCVCFTACRQWEQGGQRHNSGGGEESDVGGDMDRQEQQFLSQTSSFTLLNFPFCHCL